MTLDFAFSESIGSLITDGKHPPIHALACPLQVKCIYKRSTIPVSYTHLTLPTIYSV